MWQIPTVCTVVIIRLVLYIKWKPLSFCHSFYNVSKCTVHLNSRLFIKDDAMNAHYSYRTACHLQSLHLHLMLISKFPSDAYSPDWTSPTSLIVNVPFRENLCCGLIDRCLRAFNVHNPMSIYVIKFGIEWRYSNELHRVPDSRMDAGSLIIFFVVRSLTVLHGL